jgi:hypothetical protein
MNIFPYPSEDHKKYVKRFVNTSSGEERELSIDFCVSEKEIERISQLIFVRERKNSERC